MTIINAGGFIQILYKVNLEVNFLFEYTGHNLKAYATSGKQMIPVLQLHVNKSMYSLGTTIFHPVCYAVCHIISSKAGLRYITVGT
jgi:hypothetical protein